MGFPTRIARTTLGQVMEDEAPVKNPKRQLSAGTVNLAHWQLAGAQLVVPRALIVAKIVAGPAVETESQLIAWDPNGALAMLTWTYSAVGNYLLTLAAQYNDENGTPVNTDMLFGYAMVQTASDLSANAERVSGVSFRVRVKTTASGALTELGASDRLGLLLW